MEILQTVADVRIWTGRRRRRRHRIALVPTMGFLHDGHMSLVKRAAGLCEDVVVSIFVNPTQFGPGEDFECYPRDEARDLARCREGGCAAVFLPTADDMYLPGHSVFVDEQVLSHGLCGATRPGHFRGVLTVVAKLLNIVAPDVAVFGQKDAQQLALIRRMVRDLNLPVRIEAGPIVREPDGLAMSSRNVYLDAPGRQQATALKRSLDLAQHEWRSGVTDVAELTGSMRTRLEAEPDLRVDYIAVVDAESLEPLSDAHAGALVAVAAFVGTTRLIDNVILGIPADAR